MEVGKNFRFSSQVPCPALAPETAGYAACRFLTRCPELKGALVSLSRELRLARHGRRTVRRTVTVPARLLELPGGRARLRLTVTARGVTVELLELLEAPPAGSPGRKTA